MNQLILLGINYNSSPIAIRERFAIPDYCLKHALAALREYPHVVESAILSTCNRTEVYAVVSDLHEGLRELKEFFRSVQTIPDHQVLKPNFTLFREDAALHLMRVAAGLDSMVLGESQIISQVRAAHEAARQAGAAGSTIERVFQLSLECGKRVRSETPLSRLALSLSSVAVELARPIINNRSETIATTIIGAGLMARECLRHLRSYACTSPIQIINRSAVDFEQLPLKHQQPEIQTPTVLPMAARHDVVAKSRLVFVATSAPDYLINYEELLVARQKAGRDSFACLIVDMSVPRNVDPEIGKIDGITLKNADDLSDIVRFNESQKDQFITLADAIVFETLEKFCQWQRTRMVASTIVDLRSRVEEIRRKHIATKTANSEIAEQYERMSRAIVNQILHNPTVMLKSSSNSETQRRQTETLRMLFELDSCPDRQA